MKYIPKVAGGPQGLRKVYFCARNDDFQRYFQEIADDILAIQRCSIWYDDTPVPHDDAFWEDIREMNLVVMPVTSELLYADSESPREVFWYALKHNIPILPILQEHGLADAFNNQFCKLQCLDKYDPDPTALPYEQKLQKYLETVLVGDELARKIRDAFDSYVFLSYRKKDRKHAQKLMRLIHENDFCRDVAIWYDEFLVPGEDFNENIQKALEKSSLYVFTITPNVLEYVWWQDGTYRKNYVAQVEFPEAWKTNKDMILPVQMQPTDKAGLQEMFDGLLPACTDGTDPEALARALSEKLEHTSLRKNDSDPEHAYLIGLAYLSGVDMETDPKKALTLIGDSSNAGYCDATAKLVDMYYNGIGVARNVDTAIFWQKKLAAQLEQQFHAAPTAASFKKWFWSVITCCDFYEEQEQHREAKDLLLQMQNACVSAPQNNAYYLDVVYERMGDVMRAEKKDPEALNFYEESLKIRQAMGNESRQNIHNLAISYERMGSMCSRLHKLDDAIGYYVKKQELHQQLCEADRTIEDWSGLLFVAYQLANTYLKRAYTPESDKAEDLKQAVLNCLDAIQIGQQLTVGNKNRRVHQCLAAACSLMGELRAEIDDLSRAIARDLCAELPELEDPKTYAAQGLELAKENYESSWRSLEATQYLLSAHRRLGKIYEKTTKSMAFDVYQDRAGLSADMRKTIEEDAVLLEAAKAQFSKAQNLALAAYRNYGTVSAAGDLYQCHMDLCNVCLNLKNHLEKEKLRKQMHSKALSHCEEALKLAKELAKQTSGAGNQENVARAYMTLAVLEPKNKQMYMGDAITIYEKLVKQYPDVASYRKNLDGCRMYLKGEGIFVI